MTVLLGHWVIISGVGPVPPRQLFGVLDPHHGLFRGIDIKQAAQRPKGLAAEVIAVFLFKEDDVLATFEGLVAGDHAGEAGAHDDDGVSDWGSFFHDINYKRNLSRVCDLSRK